MDEIVTNESREAHIRIIRQLIGKLDRGRQPRIEIIDNLSAKVECAICKCYVFIKARRLSARNCLWMVGKYTTHIQNHSEPESE